MPKFLLAGEHGSGKTHLMATAPGLFAVVFEGNQSKSTIRSANPGATVFEVKSVDDWREVYKAIVNGELASFQTLGVDSLNEMQMYFDRDFDECARITQKAAEKSGRGTVPKENKWAKPKDIKSKMGNVCVFLRDIPIIVAATIRTKSYTDEETGFTKSVFNLDGDTKNNVGAFFTGTGFVYKMETAEIGKPERAVMFSGPDNYPCREMEVLRGICKPDIALWLRCLESKETDGLYIPDARLPGERVRRGRTTGESF